MLFTEAYFLIFLLQALKFVNCIQPEENSKDLPEPEDLSRRRRPGRPGLGLGLGGSSGQGSNCNFNGIRKPQRVYRTDAQGRTFVDLQYINVGYNYQYNVNCGGLGPGGNNGHPQTFGNKPLFGGGGHHKPHKPFRPQKPGGIGSIGEEGHGMGPSGLFPNRPLLSMFIANRPLQGLFSQSQSQSSDSQSQAQSGIFGDILTGFGSFLPSPQQFGQGLGDGISSFVETIPQIGQSFQGLLPDFGNFQLPSFGSTPQGTQSGSISSNPVPTPAPAPVTPTTDPDDIIYNDDIKPVHEDHDPITDPYSSTNKLPPGFNKNPLYYKGPQQFYNGRRNGGQYRNVERQENSLHRQEGRSFRFPQ